MNVDCMATRSVKISLDEELLREVDGQAETRQESRSAIVRRALRLYLDRKRQQKTEERYVRGFGKSIPAEFDELLDGQAWLDDPLLVPR